MRYGEKYQVNIHLITFVLVHGNVSVPDEIVYMYTKWCLTWNGKIRRSSWLYDFCIIKWKYYDLLFIVVCFQSIASRYSYTKGKRANIHVGMEICRYHQRQPHMCIKYRTAQHVYLYRVGDQFLYSSWFFLHFSPVFTRTYPHLAELDYRHYVSINIIHRNRDYRVIMSFHPIYTRHRLWIIVINKRINIIILFSIKIVPSFMTFRFS